MRRNYKKKFLVCGMALAMGLASIGSVGMEAWAAKKPKLSKTTASMEAGKKLVLKVKNKLSGSSYKWTTSDKKVATVSSKGVVKAVKAGNVTITCKVKKKKKTYTLRCNITVGEKAVPTEPATAESSAEPAVNPAEEPTEEPATSPAGEPTAGPAGNPADEPMATPAEVPIITPDVEPTEEPAIASAAEKNSEDVAAIRAIIAGQKAAGATVSEDLDDAEQYTWSDGRLVEIDWADQKLKGHWMSVIVRL